MKISRVALYLLALRILSGVGFAIALWLCPVHVFVPLGGYLACLGLGALGIFGRYEFLILRARDERQATDAAHLCTLVAGGIVVATWAPVLLLAHLTGNSAILIFPVALLSRGWLRLGLTFATRNDRYDSAVLAMLPHTIAQPIILVAFIAHQVNPLTAFVLSDFIGQSIAAAGVYVSERRSFDALLRLPVRSGALYEMARANFRLPAVNLTAAASAFLFAMTPLLFLQALPNGVLAGTIALLFRILEIPATITSSSVAPILLREISECSASRGERSSRGTFLLPAAFALTIFSAISLAGLALAGLRIAPTWHLALTVLPVVALFQASIAATAPLIDVATLADRQRGLLTLNVSAIACAAAVLLFWSNSPVFAIVLAGGIGAGRVIILSIWLGAVKPAGQGRIITGPALG